MMFSMSKCSDRSGTGTESEAGGGMAKTSAPSDEVASAVAAVSDEIGDILKDELGDADRADRIGAELADLSAELGLLAGLADEPQQDFPSLFEIAIGHRGSGSGSSSSSWSGGRGGRLRRPPRPQRAARRRPIAKGKDQMSRRRSAAARRAASMRMRRVEVVSDASDVGADSDSDDQWTELDDNSGTTDSSSGKEADIGDMDCPEYQDKGSQVEAPAMGQFLLPLLSGDPTAQEPDHFLIRHEDILQLLASAENSVRDELPGDDDEAALDSTDALSCEVLEYEEPVVTPEDEAALLHYVCEVERSPCEAVELKPVQEWLLGVYHSWCEISALMYTLVGTNMSEEPLGGEWSYRARFGCHCRLCLTLANNAAALHQLLGDLVCELAHDGNTSALAACLVKALKLKPGQASSPTSWDMQQLRRLRTTHEAETVIQNQLDKLSQENEITEQIVHKICLCRQYDRPFEKQYAMERFCKLLENFKQSSTINFKVEVVPGAGAGAGGEAWAEAARARLARCLAPHQRRATAARLAHMAARTAPHDLGAWSGYKHRCDCLTPRTLCAQQRKQLLRISFFGMMQAMNEFNSTRGTAEEKPPVDVDEGVGRELQHGDGTGAKPPDVVEGQPATMDSSSIADLSDSNVTVDFDDISESDANSGTPSLGLSTSSSLDSASELLLAAAAAVESGGSEGEAAPGELCRTVRHLMRSIAAIERLMDRVLRHCDEWPAPPSARDHEARKRVDLGLSEVDRKLMAMYRRLPEVHRRQLQVYRKQKKLSTVCAQLVGGSAPLPPAPASPPPTPAHAPCRTLCPEYHLQRFKEVRRKVMHMRDQQLYYHRLRMWLEDQLRRERESLPESNVTLVEDLPRRKRRTLSPTAPRITSAPKRKLKPALSQSISKPHKILQLLKHKAPAVNTELDIKSPYKEIDGDTKPEVEPPEAFPLEKEENISDTETIVGEKESGDICKEMKDCLAKFANFALSTDNNLEEEYDMQVQTETKYPESVSPPLQEMSPTTSEPIPVYTQKPQRLLAVAKILNRSSDEKVLDFQSQVTPELNVPLNARAPVKDGVIEIKEIDDETKDPNAYKYVTFGLEIKKAMEECQNIINSYNSVNKTGVEENETEIPLSLEQIVEVMMTLDKNSAEFLEKMDTDEPIDLNTANTKLAELVENMPQILANMPEIASKLSEFANASFELPEFASIMNSLPDVNSEAQLTPETLKQIRELKLSKRDSVKVTKNTAKRKINRRFKNSDNDIVGTMTFELGSKDISELLKDEKELQGLMKSKSNNKEDFKDLLFSISAQVVINKVIEYVKHNKSPELAKYLEEDKDIFSLQRNSINSEMYSKASTLFDNSVKDALSMIELRELVKSRFNSWKHYVITKFKNIPIELLDSEIEAMLDKFYSYIQDLASKQCINESDKIIEEIDELRKAKDSSGESDSDGCALKPITKLLSISTGNTFDLLIMKLSKMTQDKRSTVKSLKFKYIDVIRRCAESQQLVGWIMLDPEIATNVIQELTGLEVRKVDNMPDFSSMLHERKKDYFINRLREMNKQFMETLPKNALTGDEWLVMLYRLEQLEEKLKDAFIKIAPPTKIVQTQIASEAEILAAKGLSKIIGKANFKHKKINPEPPKPVKVEESPPIEKDEKKCKSDVLLDKCEAILTSKGEKSLLDSFYTIKSYITQGLPVPEGYKRHVISICSTIDAKLLEEDIEDNLKIKEEDNLDLDTVKDKNPLSVIGSQNPELLAKYSAQALRNAKQTLNAVAFRNMLRNGQTKSESDACDTPKNNCKWTNDCVCESCKDNDISGSVCLGDIMKQCYDDGKTKNGLEEKKKEVKKPVQKAKPAPKTCENTNHQQHVCKVGHAGAAATGAEAGAGCAGYGECATDQPCNCCYCTVFGHAPPLTTPVPRNFNETRERLRSILNKKKQKCKTINGEVDANTEQRSQTKLANTPTPQTAPATPKPPALPKTLPPNLTTQAQKQMIMENQHKQITEKLAKLAVSEKPDNKPRPMQRAVPVQLNVSPMKPDGKVNPNAMEQIRIQQLKQQQLQQHQLQQQQLQQQQQMQQQQIQQQQMQQQQQVAQQHATQQKPEPIYDLPIHNKPTLTPQQQQQIRQQQQQQQQAHLLRQQQQQQQLQQQQLQQQQIQQQQMQQRQSRQQQKAMSLSSRDTSVYSTSSGGSEASWRGGGEDPRDLDALLQYIEGPARHVDRGKKKAKKQRQRAKRMESRLCSQAAVLRAELCEARAAAGALRDAHAAAARHLQHARHALAHSRAKKKGKKPKLNPAQQAKMQLIAEQLGDYTALVNTTAKELEAVERRVTECSRRLQDCERELVDARAVLGTADDAEHESTKLQMVLDEVIAKQQRILDLQNQKQIQANGKDTGSAGVVGAGAARVRRAGAGAVAGAVAGATLPPLPHTEPALARLLRASDRLTALNACEEPPPKPADNQRKQTWEQAIAHMNQLAKGTQKEKKKQKEAQTQKKDAKQKAAAPPETEVLSKKQRKLLAKQQAEEEERQKQQQLEAKNKKADKKAEVKEASKKDKKEVKKEPEVKKKKEEKKDTKETKKPDEKKGKENKVEKNAPAATKTKTQQPQQQNNKKEKKKEPANNKIINITPDTTIEVVSKKSPSASEPEKPSSCSIMEQLSCGVQVADLRLPPGITLTRVQPCEKKEPPTIKSVPLWKCGQLPATPTPVARPPPVINADPSMLMFSAAQPEPPKAVIVPDPQPTPAPKSKKAKKKAKKAAAENIEPKPDPKMVTLRNPMFHPNLPPVQIINAPPQKKAEVRIPEPIPMAPAPCQATITPTSNGMYTIRNPLMSMMHQQSLMGLRNQAPPINPMFNQPQYNYTNPNYPQNYVLDPARNSPKNEEFQNRIMNLASFTQKNDEGYSLFKTSDDNQQKSFLSPEYFENQSPKVVSPNPIGTRPDQNRNYENDSLFAKPIQRPEPIGTPLKREENVEFSSLYTPFGQEDRNVFRNALFNDKPEVPSVGKVEEGPSSYMNGDQLPYFQRLRAGSKLNNEVTIHYITDSKFYKGQEPSGPPAGRDESLFSRPPAWAHAPNNIPSTPTMTECTDASPRHESSVFLPDRSITNLSSLEAAEREIETFKRFEFFFQPPPHKPKVQLDVRDIAAALHGHK